MRYILGAAPALNRNIKGGCPSTPQHPCVLTHEPSLQEGRAGRSRESCYLLIGRRRAQAARDFARPDSRLSTTAGARQEPEFCDDKGTDHPVWGGL